MRRETNHNIEFLRVIAINLLLYYHVALISGSTDLYTKLFVGLGRVGWIGTDLFLVIAGYFCSCFFQKHGRNVRAFGRFVLNRAIRIVPAYALFLCFYLTFGLMLQHKVGNSFKLAPGYLLSFLTFSTNVNLAFGPMSGVALEGLFSISMGFQLFMLIGLLLCFSQRPKTILTVLIVLEAVALASRICFRGYGNWFLYFFTATRMDAFLFGVALSTLSRIKWADQFLMRYKGRLLALAATLFMALAATTMGLSLWLPRTHQLAYPIMACILALIANYALRSHSPKIVTFIGGLGRLSYCVYLFKLPLIYFIYRMLENSLAETAPILFSGVFLIVSIPAAYLAGALLYFLFDRPVRAFCNNQLKAHLLQEYPQVSQPICRS